MLLCLTGKFNGKSTNARWKVLMRSKDEIYRALSAYRKDEAFPTQEVLESLEQFVVKLSVVMAAQRILRPYHSCAGTFTLNLKPMQINDHQQCSI